MGMIALLLATVASPYLFSFAPAAQGQVQNNLITEIISKIDRSEIYKTTLTLQNFKTRRYGTSGNSEASVYLYNKLSSIPQLNVEYQGNYSNIIATLPGLDKTSNTVFMVGAHYDSANFADQNLAPGATDNGAGVAVVLELARIMSDYRFSHTLKFALWNAEENECYGSIEYVKYAREKNINISLYVNYDNAAYDPYNRMILNIMYNNQSAWVSDMMTKFNSLYGINFALTYNAYITLSDFRPFWDSGYNAVSTHSEYGPQYHTANDTVDKVSTAYAAKNGQLDMSVLATLAEPRRVDIKPPVTVDNYDGVWHVSDFAIILSSADDVEVGETYYRINEGPILNVKADGMPTIVSEGAGNVLEYWSVDAAGNEELPHKLLGDVKLDKTAPTGSILINSDDAYASSMSVFLNLTAKDAVSGVSQARWSNDGIWDTEQWELYSPTKAWTLGPGDGGKSVWLQLKDKAGLTSSTFSDSITLDTSPPQGSILINNGSAYANSTEVSLTLSAEDADSGVSQVSFLNDGGNWSNWEAYLTSKPWNLTSGSGLKKVFVQYRNLAGETATAGANITLDTTPPVADAGQNQSATIGMPVSFNGSGSYDNMDITSYLWDFGDNSTGSGVSQTHTYPRAGVFNVSLTVKDAVGNSAVSKSEVVVEAVIPEFPSAEMLLLSLFLFLIPALASEFRRRIKRKSLPI